MNKSKSAVLSIVLIIIISIIAIVMVFPIYYLIIGSLQESDTIFASSMKLIFDPAIMNLNNYKSIITYNDGIYLHWYKNSVLITIIFTLCSLFLTSLVGYGLGAYDFKLKNIIFVLVLFLMMIPLEVLILPLYQLTVKLGIIDTYRGVVLPFMVAPIAIFFFRQYTSGLPRELMEAGRIDGCTEFGIYFRIMAPIMKPAFGAMTILLSMRAWNDFMWPLIVLRTNTSFTLTIGIASLINPYSTNYAIMFTGCVLAILPILIIFIFNQRHFISGLTAGGVKG